MKSAFARVFGPDDNQILVRKDVTSDGEPCMTFSIATETNDIVSAAPSYPDTEEGEAERDRQFAKVTEGDAFRMRDNLLKMVGEIND